MPLSALSALVVLALTLIGCAGRAGVGDACDRHSDCGDSLQCVKRVCAVQCERAPDCGDGYSCDDRGFCVVARGQSGDACTSEVDCAPGLSCRIQVESPTRMLRRCTDQTAGAPAGAACAADADCRNGTCALGHCVDLCRATRDCAAGTSCMQVPHVETEHEQFGGCLVSNGVLSWPVPSPPPDRPRVVLPVPSGASHASLVLSTAAPRTTGATRVISPLDRVVYQRCPGTLGEQCSEAEQRAQFYANDLRHRHEVGMSVLAIPSTSRGALEPGAYRVDVRSFHVDGSVGPSPALTAVVRLGELLILDLHFHFLDLAEHPCGAAFGTEKLDRLSAQTAAPFRHEYLGTLTSILKNDGKLALGTITYQDIVRPDLDGLEIASAGALLSLGEHARGINVFFVRNLSPVGIQAFGPNPGPAGLGGTPQSGIIIGLDTLCFRSWEQLARLTAHEIARYMGLYQNVEIGGTLFDGIDDSDGSSSNLMFYSELGGTALSAGQRDILRRSPVLR